MNFSISSVKRGAENPENVVVTDEALDILGNILEEEGIEVLEKAIDIAEDKNSAVRGEEIREAFFES